MGSTTMTLAVILPSTVTGLNRLASVIAVERLAEEIGFVVSQRTVNYVLSKLMPGADNQVTLGEQVSFHNKPVYYLPPVTKSKAQEYLSSLVRRS